MQQTARDTVLVREGNRIRGSCLDGATEASMVLAIANASNTTIKWTAGKPCGTAFLKSYNPTSVQMQKVTNKGVTLTGAGLKLYRGTELIDSWTSTTTPKSFWLNTGTYTLKETSVPNGYYKASDYTIFVEADGSLIVNGNAATSVEMVDQAKSFNVTYSYTGNPPATASTLPAQTAYEYKDLVTVAPNATAPGYTFSGWSRTGSFVMPAENVSITGSFTVKTNTPYKIEHYTEDLNANTFSLRETENKTGTTDTTATATAKTYTGFTYDGTVSGTLTSGNIAGDGSLVLKLYYKRNSYNVSYSYTSAPVSASLLPADQTYEYGAKVTVANNATAPGYTFSGWSRTGTFNMPAQNVEITGGFTANTNTPYKVEHYQKDINSNTYSLKDTENKTGVTDNTATATPKTYEGFTFNSGASTTSGDISGDGNLVLQLYYDRNSHTVSYAYQGTIPNGASALPTSSTYEYGATVTVAQNALAPGYTFSGWNKPATFTMPNENVIIKGSFLSDSNTAYTVEHYWEDLNKNTYTLHETENLTGETDTDVTATPNSYAGFTYNSGLSTPTGTIAGVGNLVLKLYYNRNSYTVSYAYLGTVPTGASSLPSNTTHEFGDTVLVAADAEAPGYTFNGWNRTGTFNMPAQDVEIIGGFTANTDTPYKVEHYQKDLNSNTYTLKETDNKTGVTDNIVTETPKNYEGFTFDSGASTIRGRVSSDGNLVLKLYYTRNSYEVSYAYTSAPVSANLLPADHTYEYEAEVTVEPNAEALGYTFSGWSRTGTFNMPAQDVEITGGFTANTDTPYKVEHYQKDINSNTYSLKDTENKTGVTDNTATATPKTYEGFTFNSGASTTSGDISGDGNLVLQLYYDRNLHTVSYAYQGEMPTGVSNLPENEFYEYGATVTVAPDATAPGYTFNGWSRTGTFNMPAQDVEITGNFRANITTAYKIEHYIEDLNANTFSIRETENKTGTTDTMAITSPKTYEGFTYDVTIAGTLTSGNIAGDGSLVLKLYYTRNKYTYSVEYYFNGIIDESLIEDGEETLFGEEVSINPTQKTKHNNKNFVLASEDNKTTITATTDNNKIKVYYELDEAVDGEDKEEGGDGIPDKYQIVIYYEVENGKWNDGSTKKKVNIVTLKEDEEYSENGTGRANIPEVGDYQDKGYKEGAWEETPKVIVNKANDGITYKYVFERKETQNEGENEENPSNTQNNSDKDEGNTSDNNKPKETKESDVKDAKNESANPKTADKIQKYFAYGMVALILLSIAIRIGRKYGRKRRKIQY